MKLPTELVESKASGLVYELIDPRTKKRFYIGYTARLVELRYQEHLKGKCYSTCGYIQGLRKLRLRPQIFTIKRFRFCIDAWIAEQELISRALLNGELLCNDKKAREILLKQF